MKKIILITSFLLLTACQAFSFVVVPYIPPREKTPEEILDNDIDEYAQTEIEKNNLGLKQKDILNKHVGKGKEFDTEEDFLKAVQPVIQKKQNANKDLSIFDILGICVLIAIGVFIIMLIGNIVAD